VKASRPVGADVYATTLIKPSWNALPWESPCGSSPINLIVSLPTPQIAAMTYAASIASAEYTAHQNATLSARGPRLSFGHRSPNPRKMTACSPLSVCTDSPMRYEAKNGMANPSSAENSRSATPN
jgi:hypothetical protein